MAGSSTLKFLKTLVAVAEEEIEKAVGESPIINEFQQWVERHRRDIFTLLIDHVDELQLVEEIPRLGRRDREKLIAKRSAQRFRDSEFTTHQLIERASGQTRKQHRIAMMALKASVPVAPWLEVLLKLQIRIRRVTSPSLLADPLMRRLTPGCAENWGRPVTAFCRPGPCWTIPGWSSPTAPWRW